MTFQHGIFPFSLLFVSIASFVSAYPDRAIHEHVQRSLRIPRSIVTVIDANLHDRGSLPEIILIQDVHRHPEVQGHIAAILLYASHHWNLKDVYLEGIRENASLLNRSFSEKDDFRQIWRVGRLSGAELASALDRRRTILFHGLENADLYRRHVKAYGHVMRSRQAALRELKTRKLFLRSLDADVNKRTSYGYSFFERMFQLRLKPAECARYFHQEQGPPHERLCIMARKISTPIRQAVQGAEEFYALADLRSLFFAKVLSQRHGEGPAVAVVGGFHTPKMAEALRRQGKSFVVLSPHVTESGYDALYSQGMEQTVSALQLH